jgi:signal transduction histidine kinase
VANLLQNAIKFTQPGTEVRFSAYGAADRIQIDVADHCGGLPPNAEDTMFLPFAQNGADRSGLGLGLTIAQQSVHACHGTLQVRDLPQVGCVFHRQPAPAGGAGLKFQRDIPAMQIRV